MDDAADPLLAAVSAVRRLGNALAGHQADPSTLLQVADAANALAGAIEGGPRRDKRTEMADSPRMSELRRTGRWPDPPGEGEPIEFDPTSLVGGPLSPFGMGARYWREGDEAVGLVHCRRAFEGPPGRVHGGMVAAITDEVMGCVMRVVGVVAYTGSLTVRFVAAAPLDADLEFRARLADRDGRKLKVECVGRAGDLVFCRAEAIFVEVDASVLLASMESPTE